MTTYHKMGEAGVEGVGRRPSDELRQIAAEVIPPELRIGSRAQSFDELLVLMLRKNLESSNAVSYLHDREGSDAYFEIPFEVRSIDGEYAIFVPDLGSWVYQRMPPSAGNHSLLAETTAAHKSVVLLDSRELFGGDISRYFGDFVHEKDPNVDRSLVPIGGDDFSHGTPFHLLRMTSTGLELCLVSTPTIAQAQKLQEVCKRLHDLGLETNLIDTTVSGSDGEIDLQWFEHRLSLEHLGWLSAEMRVEDLPSGFVVDAEQFADGSFRFVRGNAVKPKLERPFLYGVGIPSVGFAKEQVNADSLTIEVGVFPHAPSHRYVVGALLLKELVRKMAFSHDVSVTEEMRRVVDVLDGEGEIVVGESDLVAPVRTEITVTPVPFRLRFQGLVLDYGVRANYDLDERSLDIELLITDDAQNDELLLELARVMCGRIVTSLRSSSKSLGVVDGRELVVSDIKGKVVSVYTP